MYWREEKKKNKKKQKNKKKMKKISEPLDLKENNISWPHDNDSQTFPTSKRWRFAYKPFAFAVRRTNRDRFSSMAFSSITMKCPPVLHLRALPKSSAPQSSISFRYSPTKFSRRKTLSIRSVSVPGTPLFYFFPSAFLLDFWVLYLTVSP